MLAFRIGSIPVRIHPSFLLMVALLGADSDLRGVVAWIVIVLVSVLLHELGHAVTGMSFGLVPQIDLIGMTGLTSWTGGAREKLTTAKSVAISLAGPMVGIVIGLAVRAWRNSQTTMISEQTASIVGTIIWVNLIWGVANLLPIVPMDGGNVLRAILNRVTNGRGETPANVVSIVVAALVGVVVMLMFGRGAWFSLILLGMFIAQNVRAIGARNAIERDGPMREALRAGFDALGRGDTGTAVRIAQDVLSRADVGPMRTDAVRLLAFAHLIAGAWGPLMDLMESPASAAIGDDEMAKFEQAAREFGRADEAARIAAVRAQRHAAPRF